MRKTQHEKKEVWKSIKGYEGFYEVSNLGRVKSIPFNRTRFNKRKKPFVISLNKLKNGYFYAHLYKDTSDNRRNRKAIQLHRLAANAFIANPDNKPEVNHIDGCKTNNKVSNLQWVTKSENSKHAYKMGLSPLIKLNKITREQADKIRKLYRSSGLPQWKIGKMFGICQAHVSKIICKGCWN